MLGDFIIRCLVMALGYAYPAFECYKTVEKNRVEIEELRFWCQYWILVAMLTVFERIGDMFISWLPMYGEMKLALFIYLWYPKTKGTGYVYETLLRPYVSRHETDIDRKILELRARIWDFAIYYWKNCTQLGQTTFFQILQYIAAQSAKFTHAGTEKADDQPQPNGSPSSHHSGKSKKRNPSPPPPPPPPSSTTNHAIIETPKSNLVQVRLRSLTESAHIVNTVIPEPLTEPGSPNIPEAGMNDKLPHQARPRLRRFKV